MVKQRAGTDTTDHSGDQKSRQSDPDKSLESIPNLPDECGDSLWDAVLTQQTPDLLQVKKSDMGDQDTVQRLKS